MTLPDRTELDIPAVVTVGRRGPNWTLEARDAAGRLRGLQILDRLDEERATIAARIRAAVQWLVAQTEKSNIAGVA